MNRNLISAGAIAGGIFLACAAWSGYSQERWINAQNQRIALAYNQIPRSHSNPLWPIIGITGLAAIGVGTVGMAYRELESSGNVPNSIPSKGSTAYENDSGNSLPVTRSHPKIGTNPPNPSDTKWLFDHMNNAFHVSINGPTGEGKTTTTEWGIDQLGGGEVYLIDPKHNPKRKRWSYPTQCTDIDDVIEHLQLLFERFEARRKGEEEPNKLHIVIDEWDWIYEEFGAKALKPLRKLFKLGRDENIKLWLLGQSPLTTETGITTSGYRNFAKIVLGSEALCYISNPKHFPWDSSEYKPIAQRHQDRGDRWGLFVPSKGKPFIKSMPDLSHFSPVQSYQLESSPHPPERSTEPTEPDETEWLNRLLDKNYSDSERLNDWEPRDPLNDSEPSPEAIGMVVGLHRSGCNKQECIEYTWKCKKGGSKAYKKAEKYYEQTLQNLGASNNG